jgi:hypothetical protein
LRKKVIISGPVCLVGPADFAGSVKARGCNGGRALPQALVCGVGGDRRRQISGRQDVQGALIVGNWKMNGSMASLAEIEAMAAARTDLWVAPPFTLVGGAVAAAGGRVRIGGQDCHANASGAHTGCVSAAMLADAGATFVIVGHSERRADNHESDADVRAKAMAARAAGLDLKIVLVFDFSAGADVLLARSGIAQLDQLKGKIARQALGVIGESFVDPGGHLVSDRDDDESQCSALKPRR